MLHRIDVRVEIGTIGHYDWPGKLDEMIEKLAAMKEAVPIEFRDRVKVEFESDSYDGGPGWLDFYYMRPETDEEMGDRLSAKVRRQKAEADNERAEYERLKRKFGDGS